jgi:hypothetical protein
VRAARVDERQALGHDRVDLAATKQLKQREEVRPEPFRVAGTSTYRAACDFPREALGALAQLLDP